MWRGRGSNAQAGEHVLNLHGRNVEYVRVLTLAVHTHYLVQWLLKVCYSVEEKEMYRIQGTFQNQNFFF